MRKYSVFVLLFLLSTLITACYQGPTVHQINSNLGVGYVHQYPTKELQPALTYNKHLERLMTPSQFIAIDPTNHQYLYADKGTVIEVPVNCLCHQNGELVTDSVNIEVKELFSKTDYIFSNKPTVSDGRQLVSGGVIYMNATSNRQPVYIGCPEGINVTFPSSSTEEGMQLFYAQEKNGQVNWELDSNGVFVENWGEFAESEEACFECDWEADYVGEMSNYVFQANSFGWINVDKFYKDKRPKAPLMVKLKHQLKSDAGVAMYAVFHSMNSVMGLYGRSGNIYHTNELPIGESVTLVVIAANENEVYAATKDVIVGKTNLFEMTLEEKTEDELKTLLDKVG